MIIFLLQGLLRTAEQLKIKGLCEVSERTDCNDSSPKRGRVKRSCSIDQSQTLAEQTVAGNVEVPQKYSKSDHPHGSSPVLVLEQRVLTRGIETKENKNMTSLGMVSDFGSTNLSFYIFL